MRRLAMSLAVVAGLSAACGSPSAPARQIGPPPGGVASQPIHISHNAAKATCDEFLVFMDDLYQPGSVGHLRADARRLLAYAVKARPTKGQHRLYQQATRFVGFVNSNNFTPMLAINDPHLQPLEQTCDY